jgi:hypothetical protein
VSSVVARVEVVGDEGEAGGGAEHEQHSPAAAMIMRAALTRMGTLISVARLVRSGRAVNARQREGDRGRAE